MRVFIVIGVLVFAVLRTQAAETISNSTLTIPTNSTTICANKGTTKCKSYQRFNDTSCACECRDGCNACNPPQVWNPILCYCKCSKVYKCDTSYQYWDEQSCSCKCIENRRGCCDGKVWNQETCLCECVNRLTCPPYMEFSKSDCSCVCKNYEHCKPPLVFREDSCTCGCPIQKCQENSIYNNKTCECECNQNAQKNCTSRLTTWNSTKCICECKNAKIECLNGTMVDPSTNCTTCIHRQRKGCPGKQKWFRKEGKCRCKETNQSCTIFNDNGMHVWDDINCKCKCMLPEDQMTCSVDEYFDYASCRCICNVKDRYCPHSLMWNPLTCKCELSSLLPSFDKILAKVNETMRQFPYLIDSHEKDEI